MNKRLLCVFTFIFMFSILIVPNKAFAASTLKDNQLNIDIISNTDIKCYPGLDIVVEAEIKNNSDKTIKDILLYTNMIDTKKNAVVDLGEFNSAKPIYIESLKPNESRIVKLPLNLVFTSSRYYLYVTGFSKDYNNVVSTKAVTIDIMGNSLVNKNKVIGLSVIEPIAILAVIVVSLLKKKSKRRLEAQL